MNIIRWCFGSKRRIMPIVGIQVCSLKIENNKLLFDEPPKLLNSISHYIFQIRSDYDIDHCDNFIIFIVNNKYYIFKGTINVPEKYDYGIIRSGTF